MIDAHVHFWRPDRGDYGWLQDAPDSLRRFFQPSDLQPLIDSVEVTGVIAVQAAPTEAETRYLFDLAAANPWIRGVIGWVDLSRADVSARLDRLVDDGAGRLKGVRPMLQDLPTADWVAGDALDNGFDAIVRHDLVFDALVRIEHLPHLLRRLDRHPALRVVIDHAAKPAIAVGEFESWTAALRPFVDRANVMVKLSGVLTQADEVNPIDRHVAWLAEHFGPDRLIWGSDWPVLTLAGDYAGWHRQARSLIPDAKVYAANATRVYRLAGGDALLILQAEDNVGVALRPLDAGESVAPGIRAQTPVPFGFKLALSAIRRGDKVVKYGVPIGSATRDIAAGERVHLENMRSDYTETHTRELKATGA